MAHSILRREQPPERYYVGRHESSARVCVYVVDREAVRPLTHPGGPTGARFEWGRASAGSLELASALLADVGRSEPPEPICRRFRDEILIDLSADGFVLPHGQIALWLLVLSSHSRGHGHGGLLARSRRMTRRMTRRIRHPWRWYAEAAAAAAADDAQSPAFPSGPADDY